VLPVASNDTGNPTIRALELGGNFSITETLMSALRDRVRRIMLGPEPSEGAVKSATEISISDRNRLWAMNGEYTRIQTELLAPIVARGVFILQKKGLIPRFKVDGRMVAITYTSPFSKSQNEEDVLALQGALAVSASLGPELVQLGIKIEDMPAWVFRKRGVDEKLIRDEAEVAAMKEKAGQVAASQLPGNQPIQPQPGALPVPAGG
jgi:hypothetical protein